MLEISTESDLSVISLVLDNLLSSVSLDGNGLGPGTLFGGVKDTALSYIFRSLYGHFIYALDDVSIHESHLLQKWCRFWYQDHHSIRFTSCVVLYDVSPGGEILDITLV